ncbi:MAG: ABC transporter ATP-binding protein [Mesorhizobium sp.]|nr:MAG: ABC transporter ATP-binding protein [Mesorhizobium sp.]
MSSDVIGSATKPLNSFAPVEAAGWGRSLSTLLRITRMNLRHPWQVAFAICSTLIAVILQLLIPQLLGRAVDQSQTSIGGSVTGAAAEQALWISTILLLAVSALRGLFTMAQNYFWRSGRASRRVQLRLACYEKIQRLSFSFHDRAHSGDLITIGMLDVEGVRMFFSTALVRALMLSMLMAIGAYVMISTDPVLGLVALSFVPFVAWRSSVTQLRLRVTWLGLQERLSVLSRVMEENLAGTRVVRAFAAQAYEMLKFDRASKILARLGSHSRPIAPSTSTRIAYCIF